MAHSRTCSCVLSRALCVRSQFMAHYHLYDYAGIRNTDPYRHILQNRRHPSGSVHILHSYVLPYRQDNGDKTYRQRAFITGHIAISPVGNNIFRPKNTQEHYTAHHIARSPERIHRPTLIHQSRHQRSYIVPKGKRMQLWTGKRHYIQSMTFNIAKLWI